MTVLTVEVEVDAPEERVWEVVSDPRNLPRWDRRIVRVEGVPEGGVQAGSRYAAELRFMGVSAHVEARVLEVRPPAYARVALHGLVEAVVETWVEPAQGRGSRLRHRIDYRFPGGPLGSVASRAVRMLGGAQLVRRGLEAQKRQVEEG